ncbi:SAVED domain-containing protein [Sediminimonas qiaohouensis]|uniref:SAVED domain-containing protein n=1 Tax=Sediminimonas qiaohouensis TaxID=552061 RepID=UPI001FE0DF00|nr:SAVED domain-containing protein [Sediminimonas qiaohouensis]
MKKNNAYLAHIIASDPGGMRGDPILSPKLSDDPENLMLMCDPHHREIDDPAKIDRYTVDALRELKRANEERIERLLANPNATPAHILRIAAAIGDNETAIPLRDCIEAMRPDFTPADRRPIDIRIRDIAQKDSDPDYYPVVIDALRKKIEREIDGRFADDELEHLAVFGFAPMPVLMELGRLLPDLSAVSVYGRHREPMPGWAWPNDREPLEFTCVPGVPGAKKVALKLSITAGISDDRVIQAFPDEPISIWEIRSSRLGASELRNKDDLSRFRELVGKTLDAIKDQHGMDADLSVFPAAPAACAVEFGRTWQHKVHPPFLIYDQVPEQGFLLRHGIGRPLRSVQAAS